MCADEAWRTYHSLLCAGPNSLCENKKALAQFKEHACGISAAFKFLYTLFHFSHIEGYNYLSINYAILQSRRFISMSNEHKDLFLSLKSVSLIHRFDC